MSEILRDQNEERMPSLAHEGQEQERHHRQQQPLSASAGSDEARSGGVGDRGVLGLSRRVAEAVDIKALLEQNTDEVDSLIRALEGSYVKPGVGGEAGRFFVFGVAETVA